MKNALASSSGSGPPLLALVFGVALVGFQVMAYLDVQAAASALSRGDAERILRDANSAWRALGRRPTDADAERFLAEQHDAGLRYIEVDGPFQVHAGEALLEPPDELGVPREGRGRLRLAYAPAPPMGARGRPPHGEGGPGLHERPPGSGPPPREGPPGAGSLGPLGPPATLIEIEPVRALALQSRATRSLSLSVIAALLALGLALAYRRVSHQREALALQAERDRRLAALGEMSSVLAHEIRNPLASLKGHAQLLEELLDAGGKARAKATLVVREAERIEALTSSLLEFIRTGEIDRAEVDVATLCKDAIAACGAPIALECETARASIDGPRVRQVLDNLLRNALDASEADAPIELRVSIREGALVFEVRDRGRGIPEADLARVFEPFVTTKTRGTGLGLAIARRIAEAHGGSLTLARREGGGTVATLTLRAR